MFNILRDITVFTVFADATAADDKRRATSCIKFVDSRLPQRFYKVTLDILGYFASGI